MSNEKIHPLLVKTMDQEDVYRSYINESIANLNHLILCLERLNERKSIPIHVRLEITMGLKESISSIHAMTVLLIEGYRGDPGSNSVIEKKPEMIKIYAKLNSIADKFIQENI